MARKLLVDIEQNAIDPALALLPDRMDTPDARVMIRAICLQESRMEHRVQVLNGGGRGPARGLAQFERGGGVKGVLTHRSSAQLAQQVCKVRGVNPDPRTVWAALEFDDVLAMAFARLLLWTDAAPIPDEEEEGWEVYLRTWRPGAYARGTAEERSELRAKWGRNFREARAYDGVVR